MKLILTTILLMLLPLASQAKKGETETEAVYIVPSEPELIGHSRFIVQIVDAFTGPETEKISYVFPEVLIGEKNRLIEFTRIEGTDNSWKSDLLTAHCMTIDDTFSCNILVNEDPKQSWLEKLSEFVIPKAYAGIGRLCQGHAVSHLSTMGLSAHDVTQFTHVIGSFCSSEPAGFLSYDFK